MDAAAARIRGLTKQFTVKRRPIRALDGIDLDIRPGEFLCVVGPSGCGKTTLLRILSGLETQTTGTVDIVANATDRSGLALVFQEESNFPWMNVRDNVAFGLKARGVPRKRRRAIAEEFIGKVRLTGFEQALPHQLSGGMKRRVSLARALAVDPEMLLMDEPFAALDEQTKLILQAELLRIWEETRKTVVYVTHSIDEAIVLADRLVILSARPATIRDVIDVTAVIARPRTVETVKRHPRYGELFARVWEQLKTEVEAAHNESLTAADRHP